jgi:HEPN domain-containing protein
MSPKNLPLAYLKKSKSRLRALKVLMEDQNYSDVVRESQEIVELCSKGILRVALIDPPHLHDVANELMGVVDTLGKTFLPAIESLATANHWLRREREMAFYGADDFDPTEGYSIKDAERAFEFAELAVKTLERASKNLISKD